MHALSTDLACFEAREAREYRRTHYAQLLVLAEPLITR
jgi:hypothetical protein